MKEIKDSAVWHPYTPIPHIGPRAKLVCAQGSFVYDDTGKRLLDATSSWWCQIHGHCHPRLVGALQRQAEIMDQVMPAPHTHPIAENCAEWLLQVMGQPYEKVFFSDDGSTAVEAAMKMAVQFWKNRGFQKKKFVSLDRAYHGDTLGAMKVSHVDEYLSGFESLSNGGIRALAPYCYRCPVGKSYPDCAIACLDPLESLLNQQDIAALIIEPLVMGAAGMLVYPKAYLERIVALCREREILVIFDEVFTGFGRTGKMFAYEHLSDRPDIVCLSKGLTSGVLALGATVTSRRIFDSFVGGGDRTFFHGHTFTANPLSCAVALESLKIFEEEKTLDRNTDKIEFLAKQKARFQELPCVGDVRHLGMIWSLELVDEKNEPLPADRFGWKVAEKLWEKGFWLRPLHNTLYLVPPYSTTKAELSELCDALYEALRVSFIKK